MVSGAAERWGDVELLVLGGGFALSTVLPPLVRAAAIERPLRFWDRTAVKLCASVVLLSLLMNYFCTPYFFDVLHMHFGFHSRIHIENNPVFLPTAPRRLEQQAGLTNLAGADEREP